MNAVHADAVRLLKVFAKAAMPPPARRLMRRVQRYVYGYGWRLPPRLAPLPLDAGPELALVHRAWELTADSEANEAHVSYYSVDFEGFHLPGERPWLPRWQLFSQSVPWGGGRVLELGSNIGLLSIFALLAGAEAALVVDKVARVLEASRLVQRAFHVPCRTMLCDFDAPRPWEEELAAFRPTIVVALSVLHWVRDKERFLRFLGRFGTVLYEGHDRSGVERGRLEQAGFQDVTLLGASERSRAVFLCKRAPQRAANL